MLSFVHYQMFYDFGFSVHSASDSACVYKCSCGFRHFITASTKWQFYATTWQVVPLHCISETVFHHRWINLRNLYTRRNNKRFLRQASHSSCCRHVKSYHRPHNWATMYTNSVRVHSRCESCRALVFILPFSSLTGVCQVSKEFASPMQCSVSCLLCVL